MKIYEQRDSQVSLWVGLWVLAFRTYNYANQNTTSALEGYHAGIKSRMNAHKHLLKGRRIDWTVHLLTTEVHHHFQHQCAAKHGGFVRNVKAEEQITAAITKVKSEAFTTLVVLLMCLAKVCGLDNTYIAGPRHSGRPRVAARCGRSARKRPQLQRSKRNLQHQQPLVPVGKLHLPRSRPWQHVQAPSEGVADVQGPRQSLSW